ncbi:hypothetical protein BSL78_10079 [Apostichopus japonicus]|uniref:Reverse transcriptase domain-containing protein n=1 Tax=Stichopus japonicus TaxID=307972 RepID=A0A2G8KYE5_STIJA|nr:hypothetical protein BSL78_10079 [Apostichopus japonicus]
MIYVSLDELEKLGPNGRVGSVRTKKNENICNPAGKMLEVTGVMHPRCTSNQLVLVDAPEKGLPPNLGMTPHVRQLPGATFCKVQISIWNQGEKAQLLDSKIIQESRSQYASPIVIVRKKNGDIRLCVDYRKLNARTLPDQYAVPLVQEAVDCMSGCKWFSVIDLKSGYYQIPMKKDDQEKTAFICPLGFMNSQIAPRHKRGTGHVSEANGTVHGWFESD